MSSSGSSSVQITVPTAVVFSARLKVDVEVHFGVWLSAMTVRVKSESLDRFGSPSSVAVTVTSVAPTSPDAGVPLKVRVPAVKVSQEGFLGE